MCDYSVELQIWACTRKIDELVKRIDHMQRRKEEYKNAASYEALSTDAYHISNRSMMNSVASDIAMYKEKMSEATAIEAELFKSLSANVINRLDCYIMYDAFKVCGSQRLRKYSQLLNWDIERVRDATRLHRSEIRIIGIELQLSIVSVVCGHSLTERQLKMIAIHGGMHCPLDYRDVYSDIVLSRKM